MLTDIGHQMEANRAIRDGLHIMSDDDNPLAKDILTTTLSEHFVPSADKSAFSLVCYKSYCKMNSVNHQNMIMPFEIKTSCISHNGW